MLLRLSSSGTTNLLCPNLNWVFFILHISLGSSSRDPKPYISRINSAFNVTIVKIKIQYVLNRFVLCRIRSLRESLFGNLLSPRSNRIIRQDSKDKRKTIHMFIKFITIRWHPLLCSIRNRYI